MTHLMKVNSCDDASHMKSTCFIVLFDKTKQWHLIGKKISLNWM